MARPICLRLLAHWARAAASRTFCTAGTSKPMRMAMMAMTTSNSISVNARRESRRAMRFASEDACRSVPPGYRGAPTLSPGIPRRQHVRRHSGCRLRHEDITLQCQIAMHVTQRTDAGEPAMLHVEVGNFRLLLDGSAGTGARSCRPGHHEPGEAGFARMCRRLPGKAQIALSLIPKAPGHSSCLDGIAVQDLRCRQGPFRNSLLLVACIFFGRRRLMRRFQLRRLVWAPAAVAFATLAAVALAQGPGELQKGTKMQGHIVRIQGPDQVVVRTVDKREVIVHTSPQTKFLLN